MSGRVILTATGGPLAGREFLFTERTTCPVGRASDCLVRVPGAGANLTLSRHHCLLDIDPPAVRVRDLGSRNGTYVNGRMIRTHGRETVPEETPAMGGEWVEMHDGDRLAVGTSEFLLHVETATLTTELQTQGEEELFDLASSR